MHAQILLSGHTIYRGDNMKLIDKAVEINLRLKINTYTASDIIRYMCPMELGIITTCENEKGFKGYNTCKSCWNKEYKECSKEFNEDNNEIQEGRSTI